MNVYFIQAGDKSGAIKIGVADNVDRRLSELQTANHAELTVISIMPCESKQRAYTLEKRLHSAFSKENIRGEWFESTVSMKRADKILTKIAKKKDRRT